MKLLIKVGGTLLDTAETRCGIAAQIAAVSKGNEVAVVHGGGKQMTRFLKERGIKSNFVNGLRVSDDAVIEAVTKVIAGSVNKQLVTALLAAGIRAFGISGIDGLLTRASQLDPALGHVGRPHLTDGVLLRSLMGVGLLPVIACVAADAVGQIYNVNADQMAVSCALALPADTLIFLTDVAGVRNSAGNTVAELTPAQASGLIYSGIAHSGMQAKLEAASAALAGGVNQVLIARGTEPGICEALLAGEPRGTRLCLATQAEPMQIPAGVSQ